MHAINSRKKLGAFVNYSKEYSTYRDNQTYKMNSNFCLPNYLIIVEPWCNVKWITWLSYKLSYGSTSGLAPTTEGFTLERNLRLRFGFKTPKWFDLPRGAGTWPSVSQSRLLIGKLLNAELAILLVHAEHQLYICIACTQKSRHFIKLSPLT